jgi:hypothetical protein
MIARARALAAAASLAAIAGPGGVARAAPAADLIVLWAPGHDPAPIAAVARAAGAALVDRSPDLGGGRAPASGAAGDLGALVRTGIDRYEALQLEAAWVLLEEARAVADRTGAAAITAAQLADLYVYRGAIRAQRGEPDAGWDELTTALAIAPARAFDPARFSPRTIEQLERARSAVLARPRATLAIEAPLGCGVTVDGTATAAREVLVVPGAHWVSVACPGAAPWGARVEVAAPASSAPAGAEAAVPAARVRARPVLLAPPAQLASEALVQARAAGASGLVIAEVRGEIAVVRRLGLDGRERARRAAAIAGRGAGALGGAAAALGELLAPAPRAPWHRARWVWAAGAAGIAAAIAIPIAAAIARDEPRGVRVGGPGALPGAPGAPP